MGLVPKTPQQAAVADARTDRETELQQSSREDAPRVPVPSGLSRRNLRPAHDHGDSAGYYLFYFHEREILHDHTAPCARAPRPSSRTSPAVTTQHLSQKHFGCRYRGGPIENHFSAAGLAPAAVL
jgi:hypothetical protein